MGQLKDNFLKFQELLSESLKPTNCSKRCCSDSNESCAKPTVNETVSIVSPKDKYLNNEEIKFRCTDESTYTSEGVNSSTCINGNFVPAINFNCIKNLPLTGKDCSDIKAKGYTEDGVYTISQIDGKQFDVYCDMTDGYMVFQRRYDGSQNFNQNFAAYEQGFGSLSGEFWLGLQKLYWLTSSGDCDLRIEIQPFDGVKAYAEYRNFKIGSPTNYELQFQSGSYSGNAGDSLEYHRGMKFSTPDKDQDIWSGVNCAATYRNGAWWYESCGHSNLNSFTYAQGEGGDRMFWYDFNKNTVGLKRSVMKIKIH